MLSTLPNVYKRHRDFASSHNILAFGTRRSKANLNMDFLQLVLFAAIICKAGADVDQAYVLHNGSLPTIGCYYLPRNIQCPRSVINYKVFGLNYKDSTSKVGLNSVKLMMTSLRYFKDVSQTCKDAVREYACSNTFGRCVKDKRQKYGVDVKYNITRTKLACVKIKQKCPHAVQEATINNCTNIMTDFHDLEHCTKIPKIRGDFCRKTKFQVHTISEILAFGLFIVCQFTAYCKHKTCKSHTYLSVNNIVVTS